MVNLDLLNPTLSKKNIYNYVLFFHTGAKTILTLYVPFRKNHI